MADQIVITEKSSQAKDVRAAVGSRYGEILAAEGHLFDLLEPEDVVPAWKRWSPILLRPEGLYGTRPAEGGNKASVSENVIAGVLLFHERSVDEIALQAAIRPDARRPKKAETSPVAGTLRNISIARLSRYWATTPHTMRPPAFPAGSLV